MRSWKILMVMVAIVFVSGCLSVAKTGKTVSGDYVTTTVSSAFEVETIKVNSTTGMVTLAIEVPIIWSQYEKECLVDPDWQIFASWAWNNGKKWILVPQEDYLMKNISSTKDNVKGHLIFPIPKTGNNQYWIRVWGRDVKSGKWLWINQTSQYCRNDTQGNPGYESLVYSQTGRYQSVPDDYRVRP